MTESLIEGPPVGKGTVSFTRKVAVRQYESAEAFIAVQFDVPPCVDWADSDATASWQGTVQANAKHAFFQAKALVFEELGLEFSVEDGGVIREAIAKTFGNVTETTSQAALPAASTSNVTAQPPHAVDGMGNPASGDKDEKAANQAWAKDRYQAFPSEFFDNRPKKAAGEYSEKSPDIKHKNTKIAVWL